MGDAVDGLSTDGCGLGRCSKVESSLEVFSNLNREMERTGTFTIKKGHLFRLVAQNNILITEIITKLGLLERSDTAWKYAQYGPIWEGLRNEFELEARFQTLDLKVGRQAVPCVLIAVTVLTPLRDVT
jgi:uncharacterized Rmd1/YagE family protein